MNQLLDFYFDVYSLGAKLIIFGKIKGLFSNIQI